jgi:hypothetical protein
MEMAHCSLVSRWPRSKSWRTRTLLQRLKAALRRRDLAQYSDTFDRTQLRTMIGGALARAAATAPLRVVDPKVPRSWEFSGFSQHGEDGIVDYLCSQLLNPNRFFFEIGAANGVENCTAWLVHARSYGGVWVDGDPALCRQAKKSIEGLIWNVHVVNQLVTPESMPTLLKMCPYEQPDLFSLDIDSIDYYVAEKVLALGYRPKIWIVEYNSVFGPDRKASIPLTLGFGRWAAHPSGLYYGCSIAAWRSLFARHGYAFVTVDQSGCNAFFIDPTAVPAGFADDLRGEAFRDNGTDWNGATRVYKDADGHDALRPRDWRKQYEMIAALPIAELA